MKKKILIAEDEEILLAALTEALSEFEEIEVISAGNGEEAMELAMKHMPELIVSDVLMPGKNGIEFLNELRQSGDYGKHANFLFLTNFSGTDVQENLLKSGNYDYLVKSNMDLEDIIDAFIKRLGIDRKS